MSQGKFVIRLKGLHDATGKTAYRVSKESGVATNTVVRFTSEDAVEVRNLSLPVVRLIQYYGANWRNPDVVQYVDEQDEGEQKALLATA